MIARAIGSPQADPLRPHSGCVENDCGRGDSEVGAVMLSDPEDVEADVVRELDLLNEVSKALLRADSLPARASAQFREGVDPDLHGHVLSARSNTRQLVLRRRRSHATA
jgi:hypothetical protein